jgi:hypothetical protein
MSKAISGAVSACPGFRLAHPSYEPDSIFEEPYRHCERSEAIHSFFVQHDRLLRFARNDVDGSEYDFAFSRHDLPEVLKENLAPIKSEQLGC